MSDSIHYGLLVDGALRSVVARALEIAARDGWPGDHHFYITFRTDHPGVRDGQGPEGPLPEDITIVIQNQFWNLEVDEEGFSSVSPSTACPTSSVFPGLPSPRSSIRASSSD